VNRVGLVAAVVHGVSEFVPIGADREGADAAEDLALCQSVLIEQHLLDASRLVLAAAEDGILPPRLRALIIQIPASLLRDG
jgi:hypothetical protein